MTPNQRISLWAHIVSEHACVMDPRTKPRELLDYHTHEHEGPGTIRGHDVKARNFSLKKIGVVLSECEEAS